MDSYCLWAKIRRKVEATKEKAKKYCTESKMMGSVQ